MNKQKNMSDAEAILLGSLEEILCNLRSTAEYGKKLGNFITKLELSEDVSHATAEALIILAANNLGNSLKRDAALAALGLVRGCSRLEQPNKIKINARKAVSWRRIKFLLTSNYLQDGEEYRQCEAALQAIENGKSHKIKKTLDKLSGNDKSYIEEIAGIINNWCFQDALEKQLKKATEKYPSPPGAQHIDLDKLPTLINLRNAANSETSNVDNIRQSQERQGDSSYKTDNIGMLMLNTSGTSDTETERSEKTNNEISQKLQNRSSVEIPDDLFADSADDADIKDISSGTTTKKDDPADNGATLLLSGSGRETSEDSAPAIINVDDQLPSDIEPLEPDISSEDSAEGSGSTPIDDGLFLSSEQQKKEPSKWIKIFALFIALSSIIIALAELFIGHVDEGIKSLIDFFLFVFAFVAVFAVVFVSWIIYQRIIHRITEKRGTNTWRYQSYTTRQIQEGILGNRIVLNAIFDGKDDDGYNGNEKKFMLAQEVNETADNVWQSGIVEVEDQKEYLLRIYIHNDNPKGRDAAAKGVMVKYYIPEKSSKEIRVWGNISAENTHPKKYEDSILFVSDWCPFHLEYKYDVMRLYNSGIGKNAGFSLGHVDFFEGTQIGYDDLDGLLPGGDGFSTNIILRAKVVFDTNCIIDYQITHYSNPREWKNETVAEIGDELECRIRYKNISDETQSNVMVTVILPEYLHYIYYRSLGSKLDDPFEVMSLDDKLAIGAPVNIGNYAPGAVATIYFGIEIVDNDLILGENELISSLQIDIDSLTVEDYIKIRVNKE